MTHRAPRILRQSVRPPMGLRTAPGLALRSPRIARISLAPSPPEPSLNWPPPRATPPRADIAPKSRVGRPPTLIPPPQANPQTGRVPADEVVEVLRAASVFATLRPGELEELAANCDRLQVQRGQVLLRQGDPGETFYAVVAGRLLVTQRLGSEAGPELVLGEVRRGEHFGEAALFGHAERTASVTALTDCELVSLSRTALATFLGRHPEVRAALADTFSYRLQWAERRRVRPPHPQIVAALDRFVGGLDERALDALESEVEWLALPRGDLLIKQGEQGDCLYVVVSGRLEVFGFRDDGSELRIAEIGPGECVGEMALLSDELRVAWVRVLRDAELLRLSKAGFDRLTTAQPKTMGVFSRVLVERLGRTIRARSLVTQLRATALATPEECAEVTLTVQPVLRNLKITQMYYRLSLELTLLLGHQDANWCTFACNASKTAGYSIRREELPLYPLLLALRRNARSAKLMDRLAGGLSRSSVGERADAVLEAVSQAISAGNLKVFAELAPVFAAFVSTFHQARHYEPAALARFLGNLRPGRTEAGGQDTLAEALTHYYDAAFESAPKKKAELILLGNIKIGWHEQTRLQPQILEALNAPLRVGLGGILADTVQRKVGKLLPRSAASLLHASVDVAERDLVARLTRGWRRAVTRSLMSLRLPYGDLRLGVDVPSLPNDRMHADMLQTLEHPELVRLVERFDGDVITLAGSRASDWGELDDRMNFIVNLFRSRQKSLELFDPPFLHEQRRELACDRVPNGRL